MCNLLHSKRRVKRLTWSNGDHVTVGSFGITSIIVRPVDGQMAEVPWFEVSRNGKVESMFNAAGLEGVEYAEEPDDG